MTAIFNPQINYRALPKTLLGKGLEESNIEKTLAGLSSCVKRPVTQEDVKLLSDIVEVFKDFPGSIVGADTPAKVLTGTHQMGKTLVKYGAYISKYPAATIRSIGEEVNHGLLRLKCIVPGGSSFGPDHTFTPASKDKAKFGLLESFLKTLPELPKAGAAQKLKLPSTVVRKFITILENAKLQAPAKNDSYHANEGLYGLITLEASAVFDQTKPFEISGVTRTNTSNIFSVKIGRTIEKGLRTFTPTINIGIDNNEELIQWEAGWLQVCVSKTVGFSRSQTIEAQISDLPEFFRAKTPEIEI